MYEVIEEMARTLPLANLEQFYRNILGIAVERYDEPTIHLIKQFSINAMENLIKYKSNGGEGVLSNGLFYNIKLNFSFGIY
jgi:hypothetical protein